ncbi:MAG: TonB-dependent receptor, partial [Saprospiraceae bacterium]
MKNLLLPFALLLSASLPAQNDSTLLLAPERLQDKDIISRDPGLRPTVAITANRSPEEVDQLPWSVWVITADDIQRFGLVTLGDVLKAAPGVRVSASGNALEGETFLMRGLAGNQYVKILINDVPVKPSAAAGISIGAQLPIRQAERIEVLYGPAAALYGNEACAGVVNIILKESERPVFTTADISFGKNGYNSLDLMCGGKLGKDKKIFRFTVYGSSTLRERTDLYYDQNLYQLDNYLPLGLDASLYRQNPNFLPADTAGGNIPKTAPAGHESRLFGINLNYRSLRFTYQRMGRSDYSPLGLNPLSVSWSNPSDRLVERIETYALGFQHTRRRWVSNTNFSLLNYRINNPSTTTYIFDRLSAVIFQFEQQQQNAPADSVILRRVFNKIAQNSRYTVAGGFNARFESRFKANLKPRLYLDGGVQINVGAGVAPTSHLPVPVDVDVLGQTAPAGQQSFAPRQDADLNGSVFGQLEYRGRKWSASLGSAANVSANAGENPLNSPRASVFYRLDSTWSAYANYATGYRRPSPYETAQTYLINWKGESQILSGRANTQATATIRSFESGIRYQQKGTHAALTFFHEEGRDLIRNGILQKTTTETWTYGYGATPGLALSMWGLQGLFRSESYEIISHAGLKDYSVAGRAELLIQYARGKEWYGEQRTPTNDVFNAPHWQTQVRFLFNINKLEFMLSSNRQTSTLSKSIMYRDAYQRTVQERYPKFRTWDMRIQIHLSNHFLVYFQMQNM